MKEIKSDSTYKINHMKRFQKTLRFMESLNMKNDKILNLGPENPLSEYLSEHGYDITNTKKNLDLDLDYEVVKDNKYDAVIGFEILEHLVSPFPLLRAISADKLVLSVPLSLWFSKAYWNNADIYDRHYHEFEPRQLKMLLNKAGWEIKKEEQHTSTSKKIGIRPFLRNITPRHYFVYCEKNIK